MSYALAKKWLQIESDKLYHNRKYSKTEKGRMIYLDMCMIQIEDVNIYGRHLETKLG